MAKKSNSNEGRAPLFETLEPRLLLSAEGLGAIVADAGLDHDLELPQSGTEIALLQVDDGEQAESAALSQSRELVIVDPRTPDQQQLVNDLLGQASPGRQFDVVVLDVNRDGIEQVTEALAGYQDLDAVHVISHGDADSVQLGGSSLEFDTLLANANAIQGWGGALGATADILIYGCNLAASAEGKALVDSLSRLTGADVAASDDLTGHASLGGDWKLEYAVGSVEAEGALSIEMQARYQAVLAPPVASDATVAIDENTANGTSVTTVGVTRASSGSSTEMYWVDKYDNAIYKANADGTGGTTTVLTGITRPVGLAVDYVGGKLYWTTNEAANNSRIQSANLDGTGVTDLVTGLVDPDNIALDLTNGKMYWTDDGDGQIRRANLDGSSVETLVSGLTSAQGIALDVDGGKMYWTDYGTNKVQRANLDGTGVEDLVPGLTNPNDVELDFVNKKMYWIDFSADTIQRANLDGSGIENLITSGLNAPYYLALDVPAGKMYWTDDGSNKVQRANLDGPGIEDLVTTGTDDPRDLVLSTLSYSITAGNTGNAFAINPNTGVITVADSAILDFETTPTFNLTVQVQDDVTLLTDTATITINLNDVNDDPGLSNLDATPTFTEGGPAVVLDNDAALSDPELDALNGGNGDYSGAVLTLARNGGANAEDMFAIPSGGSLTVAGGSISAGGNVIATFTSAGGQLQITFADNGTTPTTALVNEVLQAITYANSSDTPPASVQVDYTINDGTTGNGSGSVTVSVTATNDAPTATITPASYAATEQTTLTLAGTGLSLGDADAGGANVTATLSVVSGTLNVTAGTTGVGVAGSGSNSVTLTGSVAQINNLLAGNLSATAEYIINSDTPPASDTLTLAVNDGGNTGGGALNDSDTAAINITAVNDDPGLSNLDATPTFTEGGPAVVLDNDAALSDPELDALNGGNGDYSGAVLTLARNGGANAEDLFAIPSGGSLTVAGGNISAGGNVIATFTSAGGQLQITFADNGTTPTTALVNEVLRAITYENTSGTPPANVQVDYTINDGTTGNGNGSVTVSITPANNNPGFSSLDATPSFTEGGPAVVLDNNATLSDPELDALNSGNGDYSGAVLTLARNGGANAEDMFAIPSGGSLTVAGGSISAGGDVIATFTSAGGQLQITFADNGTVPTTALVNEVLQAITYANSSDTPPASVQVDYTINDGTTGNGSGSVTVSVTATNDAPTATITPASYAATEQTTLTLAGTGLSIGDVDASGANVTATLSVVSGTLNVTAGTTGVGVAGSGSNSVTLTGSVAQINNLLAGNLSATAEYIINSDTPPASDTLTLAVNDGGNTGGGALNDSDTAAINITAVNDDPGLSNLDATPTFTEGGPAVVLDNDAALSDPELDALNGGNGDYSGAVLTLARNGGANAEDMFAIPSGGSLTVAGGSISAGGNVIATFTSAGGQLQITFADNGTTPTTALVNEVLQAITYANSSDTPPASVQVDYTINDGTTGNGSGSVTVSVTATNDAPTATITPASYAATEQTTLTLAGTGLSLGDADAGGANVTATLSVVSGTLNVTAGTTGVGVAGSGSNSVTLTGSVAQINNLLAGNLSATAEYIINSDTPPASDTLTLAVNDGGNTGGGALNDSDTAAINITAVNDDPGLSNLDATPTFTEGGPAVVLDNDAALSDPELDALNGGNGDYSGAVLTLARNGGANAEDLFAIPSGGSLTVAGGNISAGGNVIATFTSAGGQLQITFADNGTTPTTALVNEVLRAITYENTSGTPPANVQVDYTINDGTTGNGNGSVTVSITPANNNPGFSSLDATPSFTEGGPAVVLDNNATLSDPELDALNSGNGDYSGAVLTLARNGGANAEDMFAIPSGGSLTVAGGSISAGGDVIATFTSAGGQLQITFADNGTVPTTALVNEVLQAITYANSSDTPPASVQVDYTINDGTTGNGSGSVTVSVTATNDAPTATITPASYAATEQTTLTLAGTGLSIGDVDASGANVTATLSVVSGTLNVTAGTTGVGVAGSGSNSVTLTGSVAQINNLLAGNLSATAEYIINSDTPPASDTLTLAVNDGGNTGGGALNDSDTAAINITAVNDDPGLSNLDATPTFTEGGPAVVLDNDAALSDPELDALNGGNGDYSGAVLTLARNGGANAEDLFAIPSGGSLTVAGGNISAGGNVIATFTSAGGQLQITFADNGTTPTTALVNEVLRAITYENTSGTPPANVQVDYTINDGTTGNGNGSVTVSITPANNNPGFSSLDATPSFTEGGPAVVLDNNATVFDTELDALNGGNGDYSGAVLTLARNGGANAEDMFAIPSGGSLTVAGGSISAGGNVIATFASAGGQLQITFADNGTTPTTALVNEVLQAITYANSSDTPPASVQVDYTINDGTTGNGSGSVTVSVTATNDAPTATITPASYAATEQTTLTLAGTGLSLGDADAGGANVTATLSVVSGTLNVTAGTTGVGVAGSGSNSVTLTGSVAQINNLLAGNLSATAEYIINSDTPPASDTLTLAVNDGGNTGGGALNDSDTAAINITAVNDAPVLDNSGTPTLTTITEDDLGNGGNVFSSLLGAWVTDADAGASEGIALTGLASGNGTWQFSTDGGGSWSNTGAVADHNALLLRDSDHIRFVPDGQNADSGSITYRAWDQSSGAAGTKVNASSNGGSTPFSTASESAAITVTAINDAPSLTGASVSLAPASPVGTALGAVTGNDVDAGDTLTYSITAGNTGGTFAIDPATGQLTVADSAGLTEGAAFNLTVQVQDSGAPALSATAPVSIQVNTPPAEPPPVEPPPVIEPPPAIEPPPVIDPEPPQATYDPDEPAPEEESRSPAGSGTAQPNIPTESALVFAEEAPASPLTGVDELRYGDRTRPSHTARLDLADEPPPVQLQQVVAAAEPIALPEMQQPALWGALDMMAEQMNDAEEWRAQERERKLTLQATTGVAVTLSAGFVTWLLRAGTLASSLLSSMPLWRGFDPLPVVGFTAREHKRLKAAAGRLHTDELQDDPDVGRLLDRPSEHTSKPRKEARRKARPGRRNHLSGR